MLSLELVKPLRWRSGSDVESRSILLGEFQPELKLIPSLNLGPGSQISPFEIDFAITKRKFQRELVF